jgi:hypothetical protein
MTAGEALVFITLAFCIGVVFGGTINAAVRRQRRRRDPAQRGADRPPSTWIEHG